LEYTISFPENNGHLKTVITTNLAFNRWDEIIADKVLVTAMVDRLTHKAILLNMTGKSYRMKETQDMINQQI
jgi:DNA replication protein DnaC